MYMFKKWKVKIIDIHSNGEKEIHIRYFGSKNPIAYLENRKKNMIQLGWKDSIYENLQEVTENK